MDKRAIVVLALAMLAASAGARAPAEPAPPRDIKKNTLPAYLGPSPSKLQPAKAAAPDVPRIELAARLAAGGQRDTPEFALMREQAARKLSGRPDGAGSVSAAELKRADAAIAREIAILQGTPTPASFAELAKRAGRLQIPGLKIVYINPLGDPADANKWKYIIAHQTEGPAGSARSLALAQAANPTKRGTTIWVETDGTIYWSTAEHTIPTHGDGANRNDNKYVDNSKTFRVVIKNNSLGVEFVGNFPDVAKPVTAEQMQAWLILVKFLQERYGIPVEHVFAHNWIDYKDHRYCEGCELGTAARKLAYQPGGR
jgi:hypothetical protein